MNLIKHSVVYIHDETLRLAATAYFIAHFRAAEKMN